VSSATVWRWQEANMQGGVERLLKDKGYGFPGVKGGKGTGTTRIACTAGRCMHQSFACRM
jgi:hypothetical protein